MQNKLGEFIRLHREHTKPQDVGLPANGRRRTPGLRREELAQLCAVSPTWLTWLEQGRPISASAKVLAKMADFCHKLTVTKSCARDLANRWFQPLTHVSGGGFPRVSATYVNRGTRDTRRSKRFAAAQRAAHSVRGVFAWLR